MWLLFRILQFSDWSNLSKWWQSWENLQAAQARLRNTQWFSRNIFTVSTQNIHFCVKFNKFKKKSLYNINIFIFFKHSSVIMSVYVFDFMGMYLKKPRNTQSYSECLWNASSRFSPLNGDHLKFVQKLSLMIIFKNESKMPYWNTDEKFKITAICSNFLFQRAVKPE